MKILLDVQQDKLRRKMLTSKLILGQLLTPLTKYRNWGGTFAIDNGAYSGLREGNFRRLLHRNTPRIRDCLFVVCPDVVGDARKTLAMFNRRREWIPPGWPLAFVAQDGQEHLGIPWAQFNVLFIGGLDPWKDSEAVADLIREAKARGKGTHAGRVNSIERYEHFAALGVDTCDGSGLARYDHMLERIEKHVTQLC